MTKEERINILLEMLAKEIHGDDSDPTEHPEIIVLSKNEVQIIRAPGNIPTNLVFDERRDSKLRRLISTLVRYNYSREYDHWKCEAEQESGTKFEKYKYDPTICVDHIFHTIVELDEFSELPLSEDLRNKIDRIFKKLDI